jgi:hypothetical protein
MSARDIEVTSSAGELTAWLNDMWTHDCSTERTRLSVGAGEACNWCGATEGTK